MFWFDFLRGQQTILGMPPLAYFQSRNQYAPKGDARNIQHNHQMVNRRCCFFVAGGSATSIFKTSPASRQFSFAMEHRRT